MLWGKSGYGRYEELSTFQPLTTSPTWNMYKHASFWDWKTASSQKMLLANFQDRYVGINVVATWTEKVRGLQWVVIVATLQSKCECGFEARGMWLCICERTSCCVQLRAVPLELGSGARESLSCDFYGVLHPRSIKEARLKEEVWHKANELFPCHTDKVGWSILRW